MPGQIPSSLRRTLIAPLDPRGRVEEVEQRLIQAIELGAFGDGEQLPNEMTLAAEFGVGTVTLRDALAGLRSQGLVQTLRGRTGGTFVRHSPAEGLRRQIARLEMFSVDQLRDAADVHAAIAMAAARLATERSTPTDRGRLALQVEALAAAASPVERRLADQRFHVELAAATGSLQLTRSEEQLQSDTQALLWLEAAPDQVAAAVEEHQAILDAINQGDAEEASRSMRQHLMRETGALVARRLSLAPAALGESMAVGLQAELDAVLAGLRAAADQIFAVLSDARRLVVEARTLATEHDRILVRDDLGALYALVRSELSTSTRLSGMGVALSSQTDGSLTWVWWQSSVPEPVPLVVTLDRRHPEFYDFQEFEWFAAPVREGRRWIAGPFVDVGAANDHIVTLTEPIVSDVADGSPPAGVVGADVSVERLEEIAAPALAAVSSHAAVLNRHGVVIATNTPRWLPGTVAGQAGTNIVRRSDDELGWSVIALAPETTRSS